MLDPKRVRQDKKTIFKALDDRQYPHSILDDYLKIDAEWREQLQALDILKQKRNDLVPKGKPSTEQLSTLKRLSETIKEKQQTMVDIEANVKSLSLLIPNVPHDSVPVGKDDTFNKEIRCEGNVPSFDFTVKPHEELGQSLNILDFESATAMTGSRFSVVRGKGAQLERALINFMLDLHSIDHGYELISPPVIVHERSLFGTGQLPKFEDDQFKLQDTPYYLSPTAEVQLTNLYRDQILNEQNLPLKFVSLTPCFRKEAGSYGKDVKGIIRQHQFFKVELVQLVNEESSMTSLITLLSHAEEVLKQLELPYRVVELCTGDLGFSACKTFDLEVWFPAQNGYREISSCSNFFDFQSRRAMIRYKDSTGSIKYAHTLNGSALAVGRTIAALIENYQLPDGSVKVPNVLKKYINMDLIC